MTQATRARLPSLAVFLVAVMLVGGLPAQAQLASSPRLSAFENTTTDGQKVPFVIEEMRVGDIRHIVDYLLLHDRHNLEKGDTQLASAQLQWAASMMDLNAGLSKTPEQEAVRKAANRISALAQEPMSSAADARLKAFFGAHRALATYHQRRAVKMLASTEEISRKKSKLVRQNAIFQEKAGIALSAARTHFDRAGALHARRYKKALNGDHMDDVASVSTVVQALKVASGQVDSEKASKAASDLGAAIDTLPLE